MPKLFQDTATGAIATAIGDSLPGYFAFVVAMV